MALQSFSDRRPVEADMNDVLAPAHANKAWLFQRLRWQLLQNTINVLRQGSTLRLYLILIFSAVIWAGVFGVSAEAFHYLHVKGLSPFGGIFGTLFDFLFVALGLMLLVSSGLILFSSLFSSTETDFLLSTPASADLVFAFKYQGAIAFSSWGFLLLGSPVLIAYGLAFGVNWSFYLFLPLYFLAFVLLPSSLGALFCLLVVNYLPRRRKPVLVLLGLGLTAALGLWLYSMKPDHWNDAMDRDFVQQLLGHFSMIQGPLSPNHWIARGMQKAAQGDLKEAVYYLCLLWSNGLVLYLFTAWMAARLYRRGYNRVATGGSLRRRYGGAWMDRLLTAAVSFLDPKTRLLIVKDFRTFRRDPAQWAQVLIFTGLMVLYFANTRRFYQEQELGKMFQNGISLMNLAATALLLCAYTGRFIFPMLSLEGRKFWILGLLPFERERLLWGKFAFSATWALLIAEFLVVFSDAMLGMPLTVIAIHALTVGVLALGLSGLSVGLGAWMPNFRESDPSKIAVGFGGTLNLVAGLFFLVLVVGLMAVPWHLEAARLGKGTEMGEAEFNWWMSLLLAAGLGLGAAAIMVPLRIGAKALRQMEF